MSIASRKKRILFPIFSVALVSWFCWNVPASYAQEKVSEQVSVCSIPFTPFVRHGAPVVKVRINNVADGRFLVNTGSDNTVIYSFALKKFQLKEQPLPAGTQGTASVSSRVEITHLNLEDFDFQGQFGVLKSGNIEGVGGIDGILGMDILARGVLLLNFDKQQITLLSPGNLSPEARVAVGIADAPFISLAPAAERTGMNLFLHIDGNRQKTVLPVLLNTGNMYTILPESMASDLGQPFGKTIVRSISQDANVFLYRSSKIYADSVALPQVLYAVAADRSELGIDVLSRFMVLMDFPAKRLYLKPGTISNPSARSNQQFLIWGVTLGPTETGLWTVQDIEEGNIGEQAGIKVGDEVLKINGYVPRDLPWYTHRDNFTKNALAIILDIKRAGNDKPFRFVLKP